MNGYDFDSAEWYSKMQRWSDSASRAGDADTHAIAELAMGHSIDLDRLSLSDKGREIVTQILARQSRRLAACEIAAKW